MLRFLANLFKGSTPQPKEPQATKPVAPARVSRPAISRKDLHVITQLLALIQYAGLRNQLSKATAEQPDACSFCGRKTLTRRELPSDVVLGDVSDLTRAHLPDHLEDSLGFECTGCHAVYCGSCHFHHAPPYAFGGKACPKCGCRFGLRNA